MADLTIYKKYLVQDPSLGTAFGETPEASIKEWSETYPGKTPTTYKGLTESGTWETISPEQWKDLTGQIQKQSVSLEIPETYEEYQQKYVGQPGAEQPLSADRIRQIYLNYIGREPTAEEISAHIERKTPEDRLISWAKVSPEAIRARESAISQGTVKTEPSIPEAGISINIPPDFYATKDMGEFSEVVGLLKSSEEALKNQLTSFNDYLTVMSKIPTVEKPDLVKEFQDLRAKEGYDEAVKGLTQIEEKIAEVKSKYQEGFAALENEPIRYEAIVGRRNAMTQAMNLELEPLLLEQAVRQTEVQTINNTINTIMGLKQTDYEMARQQVNDEYTRNKEMLNTTLQLFDYQWDAQMEALNYMTNLETTRWQMNLEQQNSNKALFEAVINLSGDVDWSKVSSETKTSVKAMALAAGFSADFDIMSLLTSKKEEEKLVANWIDNSGNAVLIWQSSTGTRIQTIPGAGQASGTTDETQQYKIDFLARKAQGMTYDEAIEEWSPYLPISYIKEVYGIGEARERIEEKFYTQFEKDYDEWMKKVQEQPDKYYITTENGVQVVKEKKGGIFTKDPVVFTIGNE